KQAEILYELDVDIPLLIDDIVFDPSPHRIQSATRKISANDNIYYLEREWTSISLCSSDWVLTKKNKTWYDISAGELLIETLIREAKSSNSNSFKLPEIPSNFLSLIYTDIIRKTDVARLKGAGWSIKKKASTAFNTQREKACLIISARHNPQSISELVQFKHLAKPEYITDLSSRILVHLEQLDDYNNIILATNALIPETNCSLLQAPILQFLQDYYGDLYTKLSRLSWGPFAPKPFEVFPMIAINFNTTSNYHWDEHDETNSLCVLVLQMVVYLRPEQIIAFALHLLLHAYIKAGIKKGANRPMVSEQDLNNAQGLNHQTHLPKPKAKQIQ
ncbi:7739_t:CDS:2, partial [Racocetra persica]